MGERSANNGAETVSASRLKILRADWVWPVCSAPLKNACLIISGNKIVDLCPEDELKERIADRQCDLRDYGRAVILPGFINLHTHLEHTRLRSLARATEFFTWIPKLMQATAGWSNEDRAQSAKEGITESILAGTTLLVDFSYNGASAQPLAELGIRSIVGLEIFGVDAAAAADQWQLWSERRHNLLSNETVKKCVTAEKMLITVAPHAPYTVCPALWQRASAWAKQENVPLLTHLCESREECEWFQADNVKLRQFLIYAFGKRVSNFAQLYDQQMGWKGKNQSPVEHLHKQNLLTDNTLAAHCVNINDLDINLLQENGVSIAHCPKSNTTLQCGRLPLEKIWTKNIKVALGTDGPASSNNLNLLKEAAYAVELHQSCTANFTLSAEEAIELITIKAARCLGLENKVGSLEIGKLADVAVFRLPEVARANSDYADNNSPAASLLRGECELRELLIDGETIYSSRDDSF